MNLNLGRVIKDMVENKMGKWRNSNQEKNYFLQRYNKPRKICFFATIAINKILSFFTLTFFSFFLAVSISQIQIEYSLHSIKSILFCLICEKDSAEDKKKIHYSTNQLSYNAKFEGSCKGIYFLRSK